MFSVIYQWRVDPINANEFLTVWAELTTLIKEEYGGWGSRMHMEGDRWFAYAQWPTEDAYRKPKKSSERANVLRSRMHALSKEVPSDIAGNVVADLLISGS